MKAATAGFAMAGKANRTVDPAGKDTGGAMHEPAVIQPLSPAKKQEQRTDMTITVYSKPACVQCTATTRALDARGISYSVIDLTEDAAAMERVTSLGYRQAPVVIAGDDHWAGFRPDMIGRLS